jgi:hypothetical protein
MAYFYVLLNPQLAEASALARSQSVLAIEPLPLQISSRRTPAVLELDTIARRTCIHFRHRSFTSGVVERQRVAVRPHSIADLECRRLASEFLLCNGRLSWHRSSYILDSTRALRLNPSVMAAAKGRV